MNNLPKQPDSGSVDILMYLYAIPTFLEETIDISLFYLQIIHLHIITKK